MVRESWDIQEKGLWRQVGTASDPGITSGTPSGESPGVLLLVGLTGAADGLQAPFPFVSHSGPGPLCKQVTARVKTSQAAEPAAGASGSLSGGNPPTLVYREAPGHEGRLESLENFLFQERQ